MRKFLVRLLLFVVIVGLGAFVASSMPWTPTAEELGWAGFGLAVMLTAVAAVVGVGYAIVRLIRFIKNRRPRS